LFTYESLPAEYGSLNRKKPENKTVFGRVCKKLKGCLLNTISRENQSRKALFGKSDGKSRRAVPYIDTLKFILFCSLVAWILMTGTDRLGYHWQWYRIPRFLVYHDDDQWLFGPLIQGLVITLKISSVSLLLAFVIGLVTALFRLSDSIFARATARIYLEIIRNTPLLIQLFFIYFVISPLMDWSAFFSAVLALSLFEGAYASEMIRAGILSIPRGQWEASQSLGIGTFQTYRQVILPQAFRKILPSLTGQAVSLIKDSALVSTIAIYDLTMEAQAAIADTFLTFEIWFTVAAIYLCLTVGLSFFARFLEHRFRLDY